MHPSYAHIALLPASVVIDISGSFLKHIEAKFRLLADTLADFFTRTGYSNEMEFGVKLHHMVKHL